MFRGEQETHAADMGAEFTAKHRVEADTVRMNVTTSGTGDANGMMAECWDVGWGVPGHKAVTAGTVRIHAGSE